MNAKNTDILLRNNTGNKEKQALIDGFVVRTRIFENFFTEISAPFTDRPQQSYIVIGQRGSGKTSLLYRLKYAIEDDAILSKAIVPVMFSEEQYNVSDLINLWENTAVYLEDWHRWEGITREVADAVGRNDYAEEAAFEVIAKWLAKNSKRAVVFIENIDTFFRKIGGAGQKRLREILTSSPLIRVIGSATSFFDGITDYSKPFYDFFKIIKLDGLDKGECEQLLLKIAEQYGEVDQIQELLEKFPNRIEGLRRLTGGVPRTITYLFQIFLDNENGKAIKDLYQLIDNLTFLYKSELDQLSTQQQKVIDAIARKWDAISVKEIVKATRFDSKNVSSILNVMVKNQLLELVPTNGKNNLYLIKERFLNIWYLMRFGRKHDKEKVLWLVRFYDMWCDQPELAKRVATHISNLSSDYDVNAAIDMGNVFLSCENVSPDLKYKLFEATRSMLPRNLIKDLKLSGEVFYNRINELIKKKDFEGAIKTLDEIDTKDTRYYDFAGWLYVRNKQYEKGVEASEIAYNLDPNDGQRAFRLGFLYKEFLHNPEKALNYLHSALEQKEYPAAKELGDIYADKEQLDEAEKYYRVASDNDVKSALMPLASVYFRKNDLDKAEELTKVGVAENMGGALNNLGLIYQRKRQFAKAIQAFEKSIARGSSQSMINLGLLYMYRKKPDYILAEKYFRMAAAKNTTSAYYLLGKLYSEHLHQEPKAVDYYTIAIEKGDADAAHNLAHLFAARKEYGKADELFLRSVELGRVSSIFCLSRSVFANKRDDKKQFALEILECHLPEMDNYGMDGKLEYATILLWNEQIDKSFGVFTETLQECAAIIDSGDEEDKEDLVFELTRYLLFLIANSQIKKAYSLFEPQWPIDFKEVLKPVYYALMNLLKNEYPNEYLKAGNELKQTVEEVLQQITKLKKDYHL